MQDYVRCTMCGPIRSRWLMRGESEVVVTVGLQKSVSEAAKYCTGSQVAQEKQPASEVGKTIGR